MSKSVTVTKVDGGFIVSDGTNQIVARKYDLFKKLMAIFDESKVEQKDQSSAKKLKKLPR